MSVLTRVPEPSIWDDICKEFESKRPPFRCEDDESVHTQLLDFNPAQHHPVFYGNMAEVVDVDAACMAEFDPAVSHPAGIGFAFISKPPASPPPPPPPSPPKDTCSPREYLETYVFPTLLPALEAMLREAKEEKCFQWKRTKFNAMDFLTEYLYRNNPQQTGRDDIALGDIPFVKEHWKDHPRPPLAKSLLWTDEEATLIIQSHYRGFKVRRDTEISELRSWQREWREENSNIKNRVEEFWSKQMPDGEQSSPTTSIVTQDSVQDGQPE